MSVQKYTTKEQFREIRVVGGNPAELADALAEADDAFTSWHGVDVDARFYWEVDGSAVVIRFEAGTESVGGW